MKTKEKTNTKFILRMLHVIAWIIFAGLSIDAGGYITNMIWTLALNSGHAKSFWGGIDFSSLLAYSASHFFVETLFMSIVTLMKVWMFYLIVKILYDKRLTMSQPFSKDLELFTFRTSYLALGIGFLSYCGVKYTEWLVSQGVNMPDLKYLHIGGADVWMFMGVTLFVIAQIFRRGKEIQSENDLTV
jgi:Protein of unknown function (DUF2975)